MVIICTALRLLSSQLKIYPQFFTTGTWLQKCWFHSIYGDEQNSFSVFNCDSDDNDIDDDDDDDEQNRWW